MSEAGSRIPGSASENDLWEVAVALPLFHTLTYRLPETLGKMAGVGCLVRVPVGRRQVTGYLLGPAQEIPAVPIREVLAILDPCPRFGPELVPLWRWLADYYQYPLGEALSQVIPGSSGPTTSRPEFWVGLEAELPGDIEIRQGPLAKKLLAHLRDLGTLVPVAALRREFPTCLPVLQRLAAKGLVTLKTRPPGSPYPASRSEEWRTALPELVPEQTQAVAEVVAGLQENRFVPYLLHGVTASGKTEVYLRAAAEALAQGRQVLVLLPEIALTHPVAREFKQRFGERVALLHSGLTEKQRLREWRRLARGEAEVAVGARSAVFAPLPQPGLIVVDEEHDPAYKHEGGLPYQARDVALYRGKLAGAVVLLVSATPAVSTFFRAREGRYRYLHLSRRVTPQALPEVSVINLREHWRIRDSRIISPPLATAITETLARGEQVLLFLNRRGYTTVMFCLFCGHIFQCAHCSVALTLHRVRESLLCHYCGYEEREPESCPQCRATALKKHGVGTERVESEVRRRWPEARVARLDRDIAPHSGKGLKLLEAFAKGEIDILVGTQMVTKGHHFPGVTLVGVVAADQSLFFPEYHAGERTFQLLAQVAGRAGRGEARGRVLIQTCQPEHYVFKALKEMDYRGFFEKEVESRRDLGYPPFTRLALVRLSGKSETQVAQQAQKLAAAWRQAVARDQELHSRVRILGPAPAGLARLKGRWRWQLLLKSYGRPPLVQALHLLRRLWSPAPKSRMDLTLDLDPASLF